MWKRENEVVRRERSGRSRECEASLNGQRSLQERAVEGL